MFKKYLIITLSSIYIINLIILANTFTHDILHISAERKMKIDLQLM